MGGSKWMKAKMALGLKLNPCLYVPKTVEESPAAGPVAARFSDDSSLSPALHRDLDHQVKMPTSPTPSSSGLRLPKQSPKPCKNICAICLASMKPGHGHAIFTAECSHSFHFHCIASNVKHGQKIVLFAEQNGKKSPSRVLPLITLTEERGYTMCPRLKMMRGYGRDGPPSPRANINQQTASLFHAVEPAVFDDDDEVSSNQSAVISNSSSSKNIDNDHFNCPLVVKMYPEVSAVLKSKSHDNFSILVHLKAPTATGLQQSEFDRPGLPFASTTSRAPVDLVTVLDVSGSMVGTKLALLKRAMGFVIQTLGPSDRLSVIVFSSTARRLFPLLRMAHAGKSEALQAINSLSSNGGTNIAEALRKAAKVMNDRKWKNPVCSIMLLSDGQDTYTTGSPAGGNTRSDYRSLLPDSMCQNNASGLHIPVHAFGFGADHDAVLMHLISETSGGTFSFIEAESVIQDAFAQFIGGILSVIVQELKVEVECIDPALQLTSIKCGSYKAVLASDRRQGSIQVGDLYAEEERDFLVITDIPICESSGDKMSLVKVRCVYKNLVSKNLVTLDPASDIKIQRPSIMGPMAVSMEVDRQRNRLQSAEAMAEARSAAEQGDLTSAASVLENCRKKLSESVSARSGDRLCVSLDAELREMQERMSNRHIYETSGRAYVLSGLSSHSWQRATARGDSTDSTSLVQAYQTTSMADMVNWSQTMILGNSSGRPTIRPTRSFLQGHIQDDRCLVTFFFEIMSGSGPL